MKAIWIWLSFLLCSGLCAEVAYYVEGGSGIGKGTSLVGTYDINNDTKPDVIVGLPSIGKVHVLLDIISATSPNYILSTPSMDVNNSNFGWSIAVGDCNGDSWLDIFVGAYLEDKVYGFYGSSGGLSVTPNLTLYGPSGSSFGISLAVGDPNNDNITDLLVGAYTYSNGQTGEGGVFLFQGQAGGLPVNWTWSYESDEADAGFGFSVAFVDPQKDGYDDALVGAPWHTGGFTAQGAVYVFNGTSTGLSSTPFLLTIPVHNYALFGYSVGSILDGNGDTFEDFGVGAPNSTNGTFYWYEGSASGPLVAGIMHGGGWPIGAGLSFAGLGDMNFDTYCDVILGGYGSWSIGPGTPTGFPGTGYFGYIDGSTTYGNLVAAAGDVDKDGYLDFLVADPGVERVSLLYTSGTPVLEVSPSPSVAPSNTPSTDVTPTNSPSAAITPTNTPSNHKTKSNNGAIIGGVVGGAAAIAIAALLVFLVLKKRRNQNNNQEHPDTEVPLQETKEGTEYMSVGLASSTQSPREAYSGIPSTASGENYTGVPTAESRDAKKKNQPSEVEAKANELLSQHWEIKYTEIKLGSEIGRGGFGVVYKARWSNCDCVVKQLNISQSDQKAINDFLKEAETVKLLRNHKNICSIFGVCTNPAYPICIVMEYVSGGNLQKIIFNKELALDSDMIIKIAKDICAGMSHLHRVNVLHCDLACRNLLVERQGSNVTVKITDFGLSHISNSDVYDASKRSVFPIRWSAPEVLTQLKLSRASDVWSFGVTMWEILEAKIPYYKLSNPEVVDHVCQDRKLLPKPTAVSYPPAVFDIMLKCWDFEPSQRPSFDELFEMFSDLDESASFLNSNQNYKKNKKVESEEEDQENDDNGAVYGNRSLSVYYNK